MPTVKKPTSLESSTCTAARARGGVAIILLSCLCLPVSDARASDADCSNITSVLTSSAPATARLEAARRKIDATQMCAYLLADAARTLLPQGPDRTALIGTALDLSHDWVPAAGPHRIGHLKAAILAASDPTIELPRWRKRVGELMISLRNLGSPSDIADVERGLAKNLEDAYRPNRSNEEFRKVNLIIQVQNERLVEAIVQRANTLVSWIQNKGCPQRDQGQKLADELYGILKLFDNPSSSRMGREAEALVNCN